ncbi:OsmC-like protein [Thelephora terrestris]|uniref:OsmC-like protein n=1 Tax=Thelephora terrestris TaxID=56493 RepID=A0A9P6LDB2_9AGAM|nr:OsmC-like protein [Thelephora terrestris]
MLTAATSRLAFRRSFSAVPRRSIVTVKDTLYVSNATAIGEGRNGTVKSDGDVPLSFKLSTPKSIGGKGDGQNPEQLFAMGYASCFLGALQFVASNAGKKEAAAKAKIHSSVVLGHAAEMDGFALKVNLKVEGIEDESLIKAAHEFCPYSRALRHGVEVNVSKV